MGREGSRMPNEGKREKMMERISVGRLRIGTNVFL